MHSRQFVEVADAESTVLEPSLNPNPNDNNQSPLERQFELHALGCATVATLNNLRQSPGIVCSYTLLKGDDRVPLNEGVINIFPNFQHHVRQDGVCFPELSPALLGPVVHGQPGLPHAVNLENFCRANEVFPCQLLDNGAVSQSFFETQWGLYTDPKVYPPALEKPLFSLWRRMDTKELVRISNGMSRRLFCHLYEQLVRAHPHFIQLQQMLKDGVNICICGYTAYMVSPMYPIFNLEALLNDDHMPFGHEMVLFGMLTNQRPWTKAEPSAGPCAYIA